MKMQPIKIITEDRAKKEWLKTCLKVVVLDARDLGSSRRLPFPASVAQKLRRRGFKASAGAAYGFSVSDASGMLSEYLIVAAPNRNSKQVPRQFEAINYYRKIGASLAECLLRERIKYAHITGVPLDFSNKDHVCAFLEGATLSRYRYGRYRTRDESTSARERDIDATVIVSSQVLGRGEIAKKTSDLRNASREAESLSRATWYARDLVNTPAGDCTPRTLVAEARKLARDFGLGIVVHDKRALQRLGAGGILAVASGSAQPPFLIELTYRPRRDARKRVAIVGKGVTFDSGGLSIKTAAGMETMKIDMSGAAAVLGAMMVAACEKLPVEVRAYIPAVENMIGPAALRPGDVIRAMNGKTIEVLNTDAEGRLILADALVRAERANPDIIIDIATLTGACVVALGAEYAGLFCDDGTLAGSLIAAAASEGERLWRMPLAEEYREHIKSPIADIKNRAGPHGGAVTAALFLREFVERTPWAHIDIAGPAHSDVDRGFIKKGGVGFGVRTLARFLIELGAH